jgi:hypothetical protein
MSVGLLATVVDADALLKVILASAIAGVGVSIAFPLVILGVVRSSDKRRNGQGVAAGAYLVIATIALVAFAAGIAYGISVMASK